MKSGFTTGRHRFPPTLPTVGLLKSVLSILLDPNGSQIWTKLHKSGIRNCSLGLLIALFPLIMPLDLLICW